jgi:hypothetical protein
MEKNRMMRMLKISKSLCVMFVSGFMLVTMSVVSLSSTV